MKQFKRHIAIVLLAGFLFPQVASSVHYYLVPHLPGTDDLVTIKGATIDVKFHSCLFHLNGFSSLVPSDNIYREIKFISRQTAKEKFYNLEIYIHQPDFNFQLRGPPYI